MRLDVRPRKRNASRPADKSALGFLQFVRGRECIFADHGGCEGKIEAAHLDFAGGKGMGSKVADRFAVPMCSGHHRTQHSIGWNTFMLRMGVSVSALLGAADALWRKWPGRVAWERKLEAGL